jgi:hypothetical protein
MACFPPLTRQHGELCLSFRSTPDLELSSTASRFFYLSGTVGPRVFPSIAGSGFNADCKESLFPTTSDGSETHNRSVTIDWRGSVTTTITLSQGVLPPPARQSVACRRCGGLLGAVHRLNIAKSGQDIRLGVVFSAATSAARLLCVTAKLAVKHPKKSVQRQGEDRSLPRRLTMEKEGDMPRYAMLLLRSGVMRACRPPLRHTKARWLWLFNYRWLGLPQRGRTSVLPVRR